MTVVNTAWRHKVALVEFYDGGTSEQLRSLADYLEDTGYDLLSVESKSGFPEDMTYLSAVVETGVEYD